ncbi:hypothetical protein HME9302_02627 [Alteripontixanthobacter maritimus]|uniref:Bacteriophage-related protein n=1 Tax=Alteripontixanthobacter maritimus TaxID=2161824 RepID=A0A369QCW2_9SPHN|nr:DUF2924 domain-containing protein [Alteripontixanthobacter maritimus]RDC58895.1 hypothetical protein HME9302_00071 [Alteripontixanthobacter maritimus]RDC61405.1 hypothetical protein HME9302_02627 [Alteripontixanthobacter maritimus]
MAGKKVALPRDEDLSPAKLREDWARRFGAPSPNISPKLLLLGVSYKLQEQRLGGLSREARSLLRQHAKANSAQTPLSPPRKLTSGTQLVRDWHGTGHTVTVLNKGFEYDGKEWRSLSAIAKAITGTHWNGPRFFGLTEQRR